MQGTLTPKALKRLTSDSDASGGHSVIMYTIHQPQKENMPFESDSKLAGNAIF